MATLLPRSEEDGCTNRRKRVRRNDDASFCFDIRKQFRNVTHLLAWRECTAQIFPATRWRMRSVCTKDSEALKKEDLSNTAESSQPQQPDESNVEQHHYARLSDAFRRFYKMKSSWNIPSYIRLHTAANNESFFSSFQKNDTRSTMDPSIATVPLDGSVDRMAYDSHQGRLAVAYRTASLQPMIAIYKWDAIQSAFCRGHARCSSSVEHLPLPFVASVMPELVFPVYVAGPRCSTGSQVIVLEFNPEHGRDLLIGLFGNSHLAIVSLSALAQSRMAPGGPHRPPNEVAWQLLRSTGARLLRIGEFIGSSDGRPYPHRSINYRIHADSQVAWAPATIMLSIHTNLFGWTLRSEENERKDDRIHSLRRQWGSWTFFYPSPITAVVPFSPWCTNAVLLSTAQGRLLILDFQKLVSPAMSCQLSPTVLDDWMPSLSAPLDRTVIGIRACSMVPELYIPGGASNDSNWNSKASPLSRICYRLVWLTQYGWILSTRIEAVVRPRSHGVNSKWSMEIVQIRRRKPFSDGMATIHYQTPAVQYQTSDGTLLQPTKPTYVPPTQPITFHSSSAHMLWYNDVDMMDGTPHTVVLPHADARVLSSANGHGCPQSTGPVKRKKSLPKLQLLDLASLRSPHLPTSIRCLKRCGTPTCVWIHPTRPEYILVGTREHGIYFMESRSKVLPRKENLNVETL